MTDLHLGLCLLMLVAAPSRAVFGGWRGDGNGRYPDATPISGVP